jgi:hypothetical protein
MLIHSYGRLADAVRYVANDKKRNDVVQALWNLQFPIQHLITRISDTDKRQELAEAYADAVSILFKDSVDVDREKLVKNLVHPSHDLIVTAPVIPKTNPPR